MTETAKNTGPRKITYKNQLTALRMRGEDLYSIGGSVLQSKLDKFYAALNGTYEYRGNRAGKTVHARSYRKRIEFAEKELRDIESLLYTQRRHEKMNDDQVRQVSLYLKSLYQVAIRDNKYAQKNLEGTNTSLPKNLHFPISYQYAASNSKKSLELRKRTQEFGRMINSLESRIEERKSIAESMQAPTRYEIREKNPLVYTLMAGEEKEQGKEAPAYGLKPRNMVMSAKQRAVVDNFLGAINLHTGLLHLENATGAPKSNDNLVYYIPGVFPPRSARADVIRKHSPFHRNRQKNPEEDNIYHSVTHPESRRSIFDRIIGRFSTSVKAGLCIAGLFLPVGPTHSKNPYIPAVQSKVSFVQTRAKSESPSYSAPVSPAYSISPRDNTAPQNISQD